jgi:hypothetical protein
MYRHFLFLVWVVWVWIFLPTDDEAETWFEKQTGSGSVSDLPNSTNFSQRSYQELEFRLGN